ncbi:MAG: DUF6036 family nucleotidyltransferase [Steroidobacteraceae bacterium]
MRPDPAVRADYVDAFSKLAARIADALHDVPKTQLPVKMYVAGGAALHFYTGERVSRDVDAVFSRRVALPADLEIAYRDADGAARLLYFDRQYSDTLSLMHEDAHDDALALTLDGVDARMLEIRLLTPLDLAVSKLSRFSDQDRSDIESLARHRRIRSADVRRRANEALAAYVGSTERVRGSIDLACRIIDDMQLRRGD